MSSSRAKGLTETASSGGVSDYVNLLTSFINYLNTKRAFLAYRAVNVLRLGFKNQSVNPVQGKSRCLFWDPHEHIHTLWTEGRDFFSVKPGDK